jgi:hypothetical protein
MSEHVLLTVIAAIALFFEVVGWKLAPMAGLPVEAPCTGVDLNIGCVPTELGQGRFHRPIRHKTGSTLNSH